MNNLINFNNGKFGNITIINRDGECWFVGKEIAEILDYNQPRDAIYRLVDDEDKGVGNIPTPQGVQEMTLINESGFYSLIFSSQQKRARVFKKWVTQKVLPSLFFNFYH